MKNQISFFKFVKRQDLLKEQKYIKKNMNKYALHILLNSDKTFNLKSQNRGQKTAFVSQELQTQTWK